ncbi:SGNH/GDSL hydrolase family protein [Mariniphaga sediminis]|uniref:SGNH/GDSL hydrolase family protein n=1 Tax=Mariniphaga sediminis TaxID=1628158 RepID=UPI0035653764
MRRSSQVLSYLVLFVITVTGYPFLTTVKGENSKEVESKEKLQVSPSPLTIVAFGNSITATRKTIDKVYAQRLPEELLEHGITAEVINSGIPGSHTGHITDNNLFKIKHALDRFELDVLAYNPDIVIIGFGTNDAHIDSNKRNGKSRIPLGMYRKNMEYMINQLRDRGTQVILVAPNILGNRYENFQNKRLLKYVRVVRNLADKYKLGLVDNYKLFVDYEKRTGESYEGLMLDGVHPNDLGHELIARELTKAIVKTVKIDNDEKR